MGHLCFTATLSPSWRSPHGSMGSGSGVPSVTATKPKQRCCHDSDRRHGESGLHRIPDSLEVDAAMRLDGRIE
jgi:hypothetical protein